MSDAAYSLVALISALAAAGALWSAIRRRQLTRKLLDSLTDEQRKELAKHLKKDA